MDFDFTYSMDYRHISKSELKQIGANYKEIKSVFTNKNSVTYTATRGLFIIGYGVKKRIIGIYFDTITSYADIRVYKVSLPNEEAIKEFYCACK